MGDRLAGRYNGPMEKRHNASHIDHFERHGWVLIERLPLIPVSSRFIRRLKISTRLHRATRGPRRFATARIRAQIKAPIRASGRSSSSV